MVNYSINFTANLKSYQAKSYLPCLPTKFIVPVNPIYAKSIKSQLSLDQELTKIILLDSELFSNPKKLLDEKFRFLKEDQSCGIFTFVVKDIYYKLSAELLG